MKILYVSCHAVLEYDEIRLLHAMGHEVFSLGVYIDPRNPTQRFRPALPELFNEAWHDMWVKTSRDKSTWTYCDKYFGHIDQDFVDQFDCIISMHYSKFFNEHWSRYKNKICITRTIGQNTNSEENSLAIFRNNGGIIVRYSPAEKTLRNYVNSEACIRFYKDPAELPEWKFDIAQDHIVCFNNATIERANFCNYGTWQYLMKQLPDNTCYMYGNDNGRGAGMKGMLEPDEIQPARMAARAAVSLHTLPASYTLNFIENWMSGIPTITVGQRLGNFSGSALYEVHRLIDNHANGLATDSPDEMVAAIKNLMRNETYATRMGAMGRTKAIDIFGIDVVRPQWEKLLSEAKPASELVKVEE